MHQLDQPVLATHLEQIFVQLGSAVVLLVLLPLEKILLRRADSPVSQALGIVTGEYDLNGSEKPLVELFLLVGEQLPDAVANTHAPAFQRYFRGDGEVILLRVPPIDEMDRFMRLTRLDPHRHAVA